MKRYIYAFLVLLLASSIVAGCSKSEEQKNLDKANALLDQKGLPHIEKLDSIKDFGDVYFAYMTISEYISKVDSINYFKKKQKYTKEEARVVSDWFSDIDSLLETQKQLYDKHIEIGEHPRFIGYKAVVKKDERGLPIDCYFEKDFSAVKVIKKWKEQTIE